MSDIYLQHYGKKGMKWGVRKEDKGGSSGDDNSLTTKATLNKAVIARQDAKAELDEARENVNNPGNRKAGIALGVAGGAAAGAIAGGVPGAAIGAGAGALVMLRATSEKGRQKTLKNAEVNYKAAMDREKRIKDGTRGTVERLIDRSEVSLVDLAVAKNYKPRDD